MEQEFFTINGKLTIQNGKLWEKRLVRKEPDYAYHSFILIILFLLILIHEVSTTKDYAKLIYLIPVCIWIYPHVKTIYEFLFQKIWRWYIPLTEIRSLKYNSDHNELEESVTVFIHSGRSKKFIFRKSEQQAIELINILELSIPSTAQ